MENRTFGSTPGVLDPRKLLSPIDLSYDIAQNYIVIPSRVGDLLKTIPYKAAATVAVTTT